jgi:hypothetical protein
MASGGMTAGEMTAGETTAGEATSGAMAQASRQAETSRRGAAAQASAMEQWLARQPAEPAIVRVGARLVVANLEDRIALVDDALTDERFDGIDAAHMAALQHTRTQLVSSLAQVRYAETLASRVQ